MLGEESVDCGKVYVDGYANAVVNKLVPGITGALFSPSTTGLSPSVNYDPKYDYDKNKKPLDKSRLKVSDLNYVTINEKNGYIIIKLKANAKKGSSLPGMDSQGKLFTTFGSLKKTIDSMSIITFSKGTSKDNLSVNYKDGYAIIKINPKTMKIVSADYVLKIDVKLTHMNIAVIKDKTATTKVTFKTHFPASKKYLKNTKDIE